MRYKKILIAVGILVVIGIIIGIYLFLINQPQEQIPEVPKNLSDLKVGECMKIGNSTICLLGKNTTIQSGNVTNTTTIEIKETNKTGNGGGSNPSPNPVISNENCSHIPHIIC